MAILTPKNGKLYTAEPCEIYIPEDYFEESFAILQGSTIETFGLLFIKGNSSPSIKMINIPTTIVLNVYDVGPGEITVHNRKIKVRVAKYVKDVEVMNQMVVQGREKGEMFLDLVLAGKLPKILNYKDLAEIWWSNLTISGVRYDVPSKIYELILATIYRDPNNPKRRYGQHYGRQTNPTGYDYATGNIRQIVANLSTFSGFVFEDFSAMITNGINNSLEGVEEDVSPLEKIIFY